MILADLVAVLNIVLGLISAYYNVQYYLNYHDEFRWVKLMYATISLYWAFIYILIVFALPASEVSTPFGTTFIRPAVTITLTAMASGAIVRIKKSKSTLENGN